MNQVIKVWGHRGCRGSGNPPENSLEAFQAAIDQGADGFELDVFLSADDQLVVFHDDTLERMTSGSGEITSFTLEQLKQLRLKDSGGRLADAVIPTLDEVLDLVGRFRTVYPATNRARDFIVNIEIKDMPGKDIAADVVEKVALRLEQGWQLGNFQVSSFDMESLRRMKDVDPKIPLGALQHGGKRPWDISATQLAQRLPEIRELQSQTVNITLPSLTAETASLIRSIGAEPLVWTCDEQHPDRMSRDERNAVAARLFDNNVAAIITDYPGPMLRLLGDYFDGR